MIHFLLHGYKRFPRYPVSLLIFLFPQDYAKLSKQTVKGKKSRPTQCKIKKENNFEGGKGGRHFRKPINLYICFPVTYFNLKAPVRQDQPLLVWYSILTTRRQSFNKYLSDKNTTKDYFLL